MSTGSEATNVAHQQMTKKHLERQSTSRDDQKWQFSSRELAGWLVAGADFKLNVELPDLGKDLVGYHLLLLAGWIGDDFVAEWFAE